MWGSWRSVVITCTLLAGLAAVLFSPMAEARDRRLERDLRAHITVLASDDFGGRQPATDGETKTTDYLIAQWSAAGLQSGTNEPAHDWKVPVNLVVRRPTDSRAVFERGTRDLALPNDQLLVVTDAPRSLIEKAPVIFVGRGDPGVEGTRQRLAGQVVVMLDSDPAEAAAGFPDGAARAEALMDAGAAAVIIVLDGDRGLDDLAARRNSARYGLDGGASTGRLEAFATVEFLRALFAAAGVNFDSTMRRMASPRFAPVDLRMVATLEAGAEESSLISHNVIGKLPGRNPDAGAVLLMAHWDHFGACRPAPAEDQICNGAVDNASGLAVLTEIAKRLSRGGTLDRDVYFVATTAEELGLLGATAFAENPPVALDQIVAAFNIDSFALAPRRSPVAIVGRGMTRLDPAIDAIAARLRRRMVTNTEANYLLRRQDGWALLERDVPAVMVSSAFGDLDRFDRFVDDRYHRADDEADSRLEVGGAADDVELHVALVRHFATVPRD